MVLLGLLLVLAAVAIGAVALDAVQGEVLSAEGVVAETGAFAASGLFLLGVLCGLLALTGVVATLDGARRRRAKRRVVQHDVDDRVGRVDEVEAENARLRAELEENRSRTSVVDPYPGDLSREGGREHTDAVRADVTAGDGGVIDPALERDEDRGRDWHRR